MNPGNANVSEDLLEWLGRAVEEGASDLHIAPGYAPALRLHGELFELGGPPLDGRQTQALLEPLCPERLRDVFARDKNVDFSVELTVGGQPQRFRVNYFVAGGQWGACFRVIPNQIPSLEWAGFPVELAHRLAHLRNGLVLVSGVTGSGKSTSLAMILNLLNEEGGCRIITVEEPVEYLFPRVPNSIVTQREVGLDVPTFYDGLKYGLRQDPDVILVGEIRDRETAQMALSAAETGHLVFATLHTRDAKGAVSRLADLFPQSVQSGVRSQLSMSLRAVIGQHLVPGLTPRAKRELALEVMLNNNPIASAIRQGRFETIDNNILTGRAEGMTTLAESLKRLLAAGRITRAAAERFAPDPLALGSAGRSG